MSEPKLVDARDVVNTINEALEMDYESVCHLMTQSVGINPALADHPAIQCSENDEGIPILRLIGLLNGILLPDYVIIETYSEDGEEMKGVIMTEVDHFCDQCHRFTYEIGGGQICSRGPNPTGWRCDGELTLCKECFDTER